MKLLIQEHTDDPDSLPCPSLKSKPAARHSNTFTRTQANLLNTPLRKNMKRRKFIRSASAAATTLLTNAFTTGCAYGLQDARKAPSSAQTDRFQQQMWQIETDSGGRLGVSVLDTQTGLAYAWRGNERFPMCNTFKFLAKALVMSRVAQGKEHASRRIAVLALDIVPYSPVTQPRVGGVTTTVAELCEAAVTQRQRRRQPAAQQLQWPYRPDNVCPQPGRRVLPPRPHRARPGRSNARRPPRHHHATRDAEDHAKNRARPCSVARVTRSDHPLADSQQNRRQKAARRAAGQLAQRRQNRWGQVWHQQRHCRAVAAWPRASVGDLLPDAEFG